MNLTKADCIMDTRVVTSHLLADVDAKRMIDHAGIEAWVDRLAKPRRARRH
ncbi:MAG: hypothetical protein HY017_14025 [Betaproteobacteria bacterium]|nr:hypothetical protein [Betaproteobacteria bacterium]